jgi:branched-subunit amino acid transport protein
MSELGVWGTLLAMGAATLLTRLALIVVWGRVPLPGISLEVLRFVPPAVLAAIIIPALVMPAGQVNLSFGNERLVAGLVAALVAWRTHSPLLTIGLGMAVLVGLSAL